MALASTSRLFQELNEVGDEVKLLVVACEEGLLESREYSRSSRFTFKPIIVLKEERWSS